MKNIIKISILLIMTITLFGCKDTKGIGNSAIGYKYVQNAKIQPSEAVKLAEPYLDKTFELRSKNRDWPSPDERPPVIHIMLKGNYYYIVKENYPAKSVYFYLRHAVKVNINTGEVREPE